TRGLDPTLKSVRFANYVRALRRELLKMSEACGVVHPALISTDQIEILDGNREGTPLREVYGYRPGWGVPSPAQVAELTALMADAPRGGSAQPSGTARCADRAPRSRGPAAGGPRTCPPRTGPYPRSEDRRLGSGVRR